METTAGLEFDSSRTGVLLFSRGRESGHATPDMAIVEELHNRATIQEQKRPQRRRLQTASATANGATIGKSAINP
jgi:hypothetical protein